MPIDERIERQKSLTSLSTFGIGGPARYYFQAKTIEDIEQAICWAKQKGSPIFILGKGSNSLFDDRGFDGLVLHNRVDFCEFSGSSVYVGAGCNFSLLGAKCSRRALSGLEFASGIPGTVGGAVFMNAGAQGAETCDSLEKVLYLQEDLTHVVFEKKELRFCYRTSSFQSMKGCILAVTFQLKAHLAAKQLQLTLLNKRLNSQPYKEKSAGCVFRNPSTELSAGMLIERCGLKGMTQGDAEISTIHANFIINRSNARAVDVLGLIEIVQKKVYDKTGVWLETEIRKVPFS